MLVADGESGAECYSAATTRDQSKIIGSIVWEMARRSPDLRCGIRDQARLEDDANARGPGDGVEIRAALGRRVDARRAKRVVCGDR